MTFRTRGRDLRRRGAFPKGQPGLKENEITAVVSEEELKERAAAAAVDGGLDKRRADDVKAAIPKERRGFRLDDD
jgi:hypothetical protein